MRRYSSSDLESWNAFVAGAKNSVFFFDRGYMDYHADRFTDHSLLVFEDEKLVALFVANESKDTIVSHGGLTYGGLVLGERARAEDVLRYFYHLVRYYHNLGFSEITYKCLPSFLARYPSEEDLYALFLLKAGLIRRDLSCVFVRNQSLPYKHGRKSVIANAKKQQYRIQTTNDPAEFWDRVLIPNLSERFGVTPAHSAGEMKLLMTKFPDNIHLYEISGDKLLGGTLIFETPTAIHTQYISATPEGKEKGALDLLIDDLIFNKYPGKAYFSFGISTHQNGTELNRGLMDWKEGFGARAAVLDFYSIQTSQYPALDRYE